MFFEFSITTLESIPNNLFIYIAPGPLLARLGRDGHVVVFMFGMFGCMPVRRGVAAQSNTAGLAGAQVHPLITCLYAFFADMRFFSFDFLLGPSEQV